MSNLLSTLLTKHEPAWFEFKKWMIDTHGQPTFNRMLTNDFEQQQDYLIDYLRSHDNRFNTIHCAIADHIRLEDYEKAVLAGFKARSKLIINLRKQS